MSVTNRAEAAEQAVSILEEENRQLRIECEQRGGELEKLRQERDALLEACKLLLWAQEGGLISASELKAARAAIAKVEKR